MTVLIEFKENFIQIKNQVFIPVTNYNKVKVHQTQKYFCCVIWNEKFLVEAKIVHLESLNVSEFEFQLNGEIFKCFYFDSVHSVFLLLKSTGDKLNVYRFCIRTNEISLVYEFSSREVVDFLISELFEVSGFVFNFISSVAIDRVYFDVVSTPLRPILNVKQYQLIEYKEKQLLICLHSDSVLEIVLGIYLSMYKKILKFSRLTDFEQVVEFHISEDFLLLSLNLGNNVLYNFRPLQENLTGNPIIDEILFNALRDDSLSQSFFCSFDSVESIDCETLSWDRLIELIPQYYDLFLNSSDLLLNLYSKYHYDSNFVRFLIHLLNYIGNNGALFSLLVLEEIQDFDISSLESISINNQHLSNCITRRTVKLQSLAGIKSSTKAFSVADSSRKYETSASINVFSDLRSEYVENILKIHSQALSHQTKFNPKLASFPFSSSLFHYKSNNWKSSSVLKITSFPPCGEYSTEFEMGMSSALINILPCDPLWLLYNRPLIPSDTHAGMILGLGISGKLRVGLFSAYEYLNVKHENTTIGLILGLCVQEYKYPNINEQITKDELVKLISIHLKSFLPEGSLDLKMNIPVTCACLLSLALLNLNTDLGEKRRVVEKMIRELPVESQYASDLERNHRDLLHYFVVCASGLILAESGAANILLGKNETDLAIAMSFFKTNDKSISNLFRLHDDMLPADLAMSIFCKYLVFYQDISLDLINIPDTPPEFYKQTALIYLFGCKYASCRMGFDKLSRCLLKVLKIISSRALTYDQQNILMAAKTLTTSVLVSIGLLFAGSGDLEVLRLLRKVKNTFCKIQETNASNLTLECWYSLYFSLSILFFGKGKYALNTKTTHNFLLIFISLNPYLLPSTLNSEDVKRSTLWIRYLIFMAAEYRLLDVYSQRNMNNKFKISVKYEDQSILITETPFLLPPNAVSVKVNGFELMEKLRNGEYKIEYDELERTETEENYADNIFPVEIKHKPEEYNQFIKDMRQREGFNKGIHQFYVIAKEISGSISDEVDKYFEFYIDCADSGVISAMKKIHKQKSFRNKEFQVFNRYCFIMKGWKGYMIENEVGLLELSQLLKNAIKFTNKNWMRTIDLVTISIQKRQRRR